MVNRPAVRFPTQDAACTPVALYGKATGKIHAPYRHSPPSHDIKVCVVKKDNDKRVYEALIAKLKGAATA